MSLSPIVPRLLQPRPPVSGGASTSQAQLEAIRAEANQFLAADTEGRGIAVVGPTSTMGQSLTAILDVIRTEAMRLMNGWRNPAPAPAKPNEAPPFALPELGQILDQLLPPAKPEKPNKPEKPKPKPKPEKPKPKPKPEKPKPVKDLHANRNAWYISQYKSKYNTREDVPGYDNANCGPTSLTMIAKAFGKIKPSAAGADAAIEETRRRMGDGSNERNGTSIAGLARGAKSYGLDTRTLWNANSTSIKKELAQGRLVIVHGTVIKDDGRTYGGHYYVVTKIENGKAYLNDPAYPSGPRVIPVGILDKSINTRGTHAMVSIGA